MYKYEPLSEEKLRSIAPGDVIERMLAYTIPCYLIVSEVTDDKILAGWEFDRHTGLEIDDDLTHPASYIRRVLTEEEREEIRATK